MRPYVVNGQLLRKVGKYSLSDAMSPKTVAPKSHEMADAKNHRTGVDVDWSIRARSIANSAEDVGRDTGAELDSAAGTDVCVVFSATAVISILSS
jgi:hypothetical protein